MAINIDNSNHYFVKEFTKRTLHILNEYKGEYDVTMMLNSAVGLLIVPKEVYFQNTIADSVISEEMLKQLQGCIQINLQDGKPCVDNCLRTIIRHMRNSIAHGRMTIRVKETNICSQMADIDAIEFYDAGTYRDKKTNKKVAVEFEIVLEINMFKELLMAIAQYIAEQ